MTTFRRSMVRAAAALLTTLALILTVASSAFAQAAATTATTTTTAPATGAMEAVPALAGDTSGVLYIWLWLLVAGGIVSVVVAMAVANPRRR